MKDQYTDTFTSTHDMHFEYIIEDLVRDAFNNVVFNHGSKYKPLGTGKYKKSPMQSGAAAVACLLLFITFESAIRRKYFYKIKNAKSAYKGSLWGVYAKLHGSKEIKPGVKEIFSELELVRDLVAHAYVFEGTMHRSVDHRIDGLYEKAVAGRNAKMLRRRRTPKLRLCCSPNQIGFKEVAIFYQATKALLKIIELDLPYALWKWEKTGDELEASEWLEKAMRYLHLDKSKVWKELVTLEDTADYERFFKDIDDELANQVF